MERFFQLIDTLLACVTIKDYLTMSLRVFIPFPNLTRYKPVFTALDTFFSGELSMMRVIKMVIICCVSVTVFLGVAGVVSVLWLG